MALQSDLVTAEMIASSEFPELALKYHVSSVPQTTINHGAGTVIGAYPEPNMIEEIKKALTA